MEETREIKSEEKKPPKKKSFVKRLFRVMLYISLGLIGLNIALYLLLSIPAVQQKVADYAVGKLKETLKTELAIDEVRLKRFNKVSLKGIYIEDQAKDTLIYAQNLEARLSPWELIKGNGLAITGISLKDFVINVNKKNSVSDFNFQFIIDAFSSTDTTQVDTTKSSMKIVIKDVDLHNGQLNYDVLSDTLTPGLFNASHISVYALNANVDLNSIDPDKFDISLNRLSAKEKSGLEITSLKGHFYSDKSQMWVDGLTLNLPQSHLITNKVQYNLSSGEFEIGTEDTEISPADLVAFLPNLKFLKNNIILNTSITGILPAINIDSINIAYGEDFLLKGKAYIASYMQYGNSDIGLSIDKLRATPSAVTSFARLGDSTFVSPDILRDMGDIFLKGQLTGQLDKFRLDAETWCRQGLISLLATGNIDTTFTNFDVSVGLRTQNFNLGRLLEIDTVLNKLSASISLKAHQSEKESLSAQVQGNIEALEFRKGTMKNLPLNAYYNAGGMGLSAKADWRIGKITIDASMSQDRNPDVNVNLKIDTLHVDYFHKNEAWVNPRLSFDLKGKIKGLDIDRMTGLATIDGFDFHGDNFSFKPGRFSLEAGKTGNNNKYINLNSSLLTANIEGHYTFTTLADELTDLMENYLPDVFYHTYHIHKKKDTNNFTFNITAKNTEELGRIFDLPFAIVEPATLSGKIGMEEKQLSIKGSIPYVRFGEYNIKNTTIDIANYDSTFSTVAASKIFMGEGNYDLSLSLYGAKNAVDAKINLLSNNTDIDINGTLEARTEFSRDEKKQLVSFLKIFPSDLMVGRLPLNILPAEILNSGERTEIHNFGLGLNKRRYFGIDGVISNLETDSLTAYFDHAEIGDLLEAFDIKDIRGNINGNVLLTNLLKQPELYTHGLKMSDIVIYGDTLGTMNLESQWSDEFGGVILNASLIKKEEILAEIDGTVYTNQDSLDLQLRLDNMPLKWMQPFVTGMLNKVDGNLSTNLIVSGSMKEPQLRGFLGFNNTQIGIDYTNVVYTISDTIRVSPDRIGFDNLSLKDSQGNSANVSATVTHKNFGNMKYSLDMNMNKLMVLNTEHRTDSLFYGRVYASGNVRINGDDNGIDINMQMRNDRNSSLNILLPQHSEASEYKSVVYINVPEEKKEASIKNMLSSVKEAPLPIRLNVKLDVTQDITLGVVIDPVTGDELRAKGSGTINFSYDMSTENMAAYGDYTLSGGLVRLNLQNIKKLDFAIQDGSKLYFSGDPMKTRFDISAYRRVRADLKTLDSSFDNDNYPSRVDVDCILEISGNVDKMDLSYNISIPDVSDDIRASINSYISTEEQKTWQFASLVATNSFYSNMGSSGANFGNSLWTGLASSALSSGLTALMGNMLGDKWQIGANIGTADGSLSEMDMSVNVSREFWNDKLKLNTNLGYRTDRTAASDNTFIGDFELEYELNSMWTLKAYNHTNDNYEKQAPYTQGVGIVYNKEASTLKRLFQSFRPRRRRSQQIMEQGRLNQQRTDSIPSDSIRTTIEKQPITE